MPIAGPGPDRAVGALRRLVRAVGHRCRRASASSAPTTSRSSSTSSSASSAFSRCCSLNDVVEREDLPPGEYYALTLFAISGMMLMAAADGPARHLPRARGALAVGLRAHGAPPREPGRRGGGVQVLPARRVLERVLPLRHRVRVRHRRAPRGSTPWRRAIASGPSTHARAADGRPARRRLRVQGVRRAVPHVDARRLRGRARRL